MTDSIEPTAEQIAEASAILNAHHEALARREAEKRAAYVGRFFKYRNSYSCPETEADYWWHYTAVTGQNEDGALLGVQFQRTKSGVIEMETKPFLQGIEDRNYREIDPVEFYDALASFAFGVHEVVASLSNPIAPSSRAEGGT